MEKTVNASANIRRIVAELVAKYNPSYSADYVEAQMIACTNNLIKFMRAHPANTRDYMAVLGFRVEVNAYESSYEVNYLIDGNVLFYWEREDHREHR